MEKDQIEFIFYHYQKIQDVIDEKRTDIILNETHRINVTGRTYNISDRTANKAMKLLEPIPSVYIVYGDKHLGKTVFSPEKWLKAVRDTKAFYDKSYRGELIRRRYGMREDRHKTCEILKMSLRRYHYLVDEIIEKTKEFAEEQKK